MCTSKIEDSIFNILLPKYITVWFDILQELRPI